MADQSAHLNPLSRFEKHCTTLPNGGQAVGSLDAAPPAPASDPPAPLRHTSTSNSAPSNVSSPAPSSAAVVASPWTSFATPSATPEIDTAAILKDAVDQVQRLRLQTIATATITENVTIPPELCKQWIENYFTHMQTEMFVSLINLKLIKLIPDLLDLPHVHLDPAILVVYYGILYHGCALGATFEGNAGSGLHCDLHAAECFDEELSWRMYTYATDYAQKLNIHNLDAHTEGTSVLLDQAKLDADRKGFWEMIQIDFFFRLLFNKPPSITASINSWKVNLPWLSADAQPDINAVPTIAFLVGSRQTFILSRFFQELENSNCTEEEMRPKTEDLCREIGQLFAEWGVEEWVTKTMSSENQSEAWMMSDVAMSGYTYVIFMLRKLSVLRSNSPRPVMSDADVPDSPLAVDASRRLLSVVHIVLVKNPFPETMCVLFGMYRLYVAYACLMNSVLHSADVRAHMDDVALLEQVCDVMTIASRGEKDFVPLIRAIQSLGMEVKRRLNEPGTTITTPMLGLGT
ncbi:hypothetical protein Brms1b_000763 [Colletotrichum noveboracense]|nr:hypothetical protein Brms1b_000763 [Colletotrichum noveboracense]